MNRTGKSSMRGVHFAAICTLIAVAISCLPHTASASMPLNLEASTQACKVVKKGNSFELTGEKSDLFANVALAPAGKRKYLDLSEFKYVSVRIKNLSNKPVSFSLWALSEGGFSGATVEDKTQSRLAAHEEKTFNIDLETRFTGPDTLFDCIDRSKVKSVNLAVQRFGTVEVDTIGGRNIYSNPVKLLISDIRANGKPDRSVDKAGIAKRYHTPEILPEGTAPAAGKRFYKCLKGYENTEVRHIVFLPKNWSRNGKFPVIVEYTGNVFYHPKGYCYSTGFANQSNLGSALGRGEDFIVLTLPFISKDGLREQSNAWGDPNKAVQYCLDALKDAETLYGADPRAYVFTGFSRGEIAINYIGLRNDKISKKWLCFVRAASSVWPSKWNNAQNGWEERHLRIGNRPVLNCSPKYGSAHVDICFNEDTPASIQTRKELRKIVSEALGQKK